MLRGRCVDMVAYSAAPSYTHIKLLRGEDPAVDEMATWWLNCLVSWSTTLLGLTNDVLLLQSVESFCHCQVANPLWTPECQNGRSPEEEKAYRLVCCYRHIYFQKYVIPLKELGTGLEHYDTASAEVVESVICQISSLLLENRKGLSRLFPINAEESKIGDDFGRTLAFAGRAVGRTSSGRFFNAMHAVRRGDMIAALEGSKGRLWTLRPAGNNTYRIIGDVYVDGYMNGELFNGVEPKDVDHDISIV